MLSLNNPPLSTFFQVKVFFHAFVVSGNKNSSAFSLVNVYEYTGMSVVVLNQDEEPY